MSLHNPLVGSTIFPTREPVASPDAIPTNPKNRASLTPSTNLGFIVFGCVGVLVLLHMGGFRTTVAVTKG